MRRLAALFVLGALFVCLPAVAVAGVGDPLTLTVTPDTPVTGGDTISFTLADGTFFNFVLIFFGDALGEFPFGELTMDITPMGALPLGFFPADGILQFDIPLTPDLPPELSGTIIYLQAASIGLDTGGLLWRESNVDQIEFL